MGHGNNNTNTGAETMTTSISRVNFTYAMPGGMWIERTSGVRSWETFKVIATEVGNAELDRLRHVAYADGMTGQWHAC